MYSVMTRLNKALIIIMYKTKMQEYVQKGPDKHVLCGCSDAEK